jgi:predicted MarR family transcription regulator
LDCFTTSARELAPENFMIENPLDESQSPPPSDAQRLSTFEYDLITVMFGFFRWIETCMNAADVIGLNSLDILILHALNRRAKGQRLSEIGVVLNIDDTHLLAYSLKKLMNAGLVQATRTGRERIFVTTIEGDTACTNYHRIRENFFVREVVKHESDFEDFEKVAATLSNLASTYDRAGRAALVATASRPKTPPVRTKR